MSQPRHLLTVLHAAELSGPPIFALQFLRWLAAHDPTWRFSTLFLDSGGPMEGPFGDLGRVVVADGLAPHSAGRGRARRMRTARLHRTLRSQLAADGRIDLVHVHCAGSFKVVPALPPAPILGHLHELSVGQDLHLGPLARAHVASADRYVAVSEGVRQEFLDRFPVDSERVERQWGFVDPDRLAVAAEGAAAAAGSYPPGAFVVASSGVRHWRKAPELFVRIAQRTRQLAPEVPWHFVWIGGEDAGGMEGLLERAGLDDLVSFLPHQPDPLAMIAASDAFVLPAREDAFPLVCVEAAGAGVPIVTFENGGAAELVRAAGCGETAPYLDVDRFARRLIALAGDADRRRHLGEAGRRFAADHLLIDQAGPLLRDALERAVSGARSGDRRPAAAR
ncbi:glycosyltransferase family 4 protein [Aquihabitans daechungensis]|uniref:glycosyltransferase family 4 protein n=1 Tax=Aquihabitans daechungensis TaxID=1052257 RepID=UPI003B9E9A05